MSGFKKGDFGLTRDGRPYVVTAVDSHPTHPVEAWVDNTWSEAFGPDGRVSPNGEHEGDLLANEGSPQNDWASEEYSLRLQTHGDLVRISVGDHSLVLSRGSSEALLGMLESLESGVME